jgi:sodium transport system permease protein
MSNGDVPFWFVLLAFAAAPAFCEEVVFRGFILSGFGRHGRVVLAIGLSSIAFGLMHMIPEQVFNATLMGLVLGALAVRSRSLLPCIVFHFANNTLGVLHARFGAEWLRQIPENPFVAVRGGSARYDGPLLVLCVLVATPILWWLARPLFARKPAHRDQQAASGIMTSVPA